MGSFRSLFIAVVLVSCSLKSVLAEKDQHDAYTSQIDNVKRDYGGEGDDGSMDHAWSSRWSSASWTSSWTSSWGAHATGVDGTNEGHQQRGGGGGHGHDDDNDDDDSSDDGQEGSRGGPFDHNEKDGGANDWGDGQGGINHNNGTDHGGIHATGTQSLSEMPGPDGQGKGSGSEDSSSSNDAVEEPTSTGLPDTEDEDDDDSNDSIDSDSLDSAPSNDDADSSGLSMYAPSRIRMLVAQAAAAVALLASVGGM